LGWTFVNFERVDVSGTDIEAPYALPSPWGKWNLALGASQTSKYEVLIASGAAVEDRLSHINSEAWAPKWKVRLSVDLERGPWSIGATGRYRRHSGATEGVATSRCVFPPLGNPASAARSNNTFSAVLLKTQRRPQRVQAKHESLDSL
jgi:hypothetical protein